MTLFNQHWIGYDGAPLTGATPPVLRVFGPELTPQQQGGVAHAYKLFCTAVAASALPGGYHVQHRKFTDGTTVKMQSINGTHVVEVHTSGGGEKTQIARGFAVRPTWANGDVATWPDDTTLVEYDIPNVEWTKWISPYRIGRGATPTYFLDAAQRTKAKGVEIQEETHFADVYTLTSSGGMYLNGRPFKSLGTGPLALPIKVKDAEDPPNVAWFLAGDLGIHRANEGPASTTRDVLFDKETSFGSTLGSSLQYDAGVRHRGDANVDHLRIAITAGAATQVHRHTAALLPEAPWLTTSGVAFQQMNAASALSYRGGYMTATGYRPASPFVPLRDNNAMYIGSGIYAGQMKALYDRGRNSINTTLSDGDTITLYPDIQASYARSVSLNVNLETGNGTWGGTWPGGKPGVWTASSTPKDFEVGPYGYYKTPFDGPDSSGIFSGDIVTSVLLEIGGSVRCDDSASSTTSISTPSGGFTIFSSTAQHDYSFTKVDTYEHKKVIPYTGGHNHNIPVYGIWTYIPIWYVGSTEYGGWGYNEFASTNWQEFIFAEKTYGNQGDLNIRKIDTYTVQAASKDYILFDTENGVYLYVEGTLTGDYNHDETTVTSGLNNLQDNSSTTGSMTVTIKLKLDTPMGNFQATVDARSFAYAPKVNLIPPEDIYQNTDFTWRYMSPGMAPPIFIPKWFNQGACPYIAYTTAAESASATGAAPPLTFAQRMIASFRLRVLWMSRSPLAPVPEVPAAETVYLPMLEAMLIAHFPGIFFYTYADLEAAAMTLNASSPNGLLSDIGLPSADAHTEVFRT